MAHKRKQQRRIRALARLLKLPITPDAHLAAKRDAEHATLVAAIGNDRAAS